MTLTRNRIRLLGEARRSLSKVMNTLDLGEEECKGCGSRHYDNFDDNQLGKKLSGMIRKIDNEISKLNGNAKKGRGDFHAKETL